jgi:signal recognition particle subunit SRP19
MPLPDKPIEPPAAPRGWKLNAILPLHSPAVSGGGVSENFLKDMMAEMQGGPAGAIGPPSGGAGGSKKKDKKKGKP